MLFRLPSLLPKHKSNSKSSRYTLVIRHRAIQLTTKESFIWKQQVKEHQSDVRSISVDKRQQTDWTKKTHTKNNHQTNWKKQIHNTNYYNCDHIPLAHLPWTPTCIHPSTHTHLHTYAQKPTPMPKLLTQPTHTPLSVLSSTRHTHHWIHHWIHRPHLYVQNANIVNWHRHPPNTSACMALTSHYRAPE